MGHKPSATKGRAVIVGQNKDILEAIATASDVAMAKQDADREASLVAIKARHANELKSAKRNHKHRAKKITDRMKYFEDLDPLELAERFKNGVGDDVMTDFIYMYPHQLAILDMGSFENKLMMSVMKPHRIGKSAMDDARYGIGGPRHGWPSRIDLETRQS